MHQGWENLLFLHWEYPAEALQKTLPPGLTVDRFGDRAYLGVVPFFMCRIRPAFLPPLPWLSWFLELNVRTYVHDCHGIPGVWFYSLDASQPVAVSIARSLFHLPYFHARMTASAEDWIDYRSTRKKTGATAAYRYRGTGSAREPEPSSLEFFLLERYFLYSIRNKTLYRGQVAHRPYRFQEAEVETFSALPAQLGGFTGLDRPPVHQCFSKKLNVRVLGLEKIS